MNVLAHADPNWIGVQINNNKYMENSEFSVFDMSGKIMVHTNARLLMGNNEMLLNVGNLSGGIYMLHVRQGGVNLSSKFVVVK